MDWKKAKSILIAVFFMLNIVLSISLYNIIKVDNISDDTVKNTQSILEKNNVIIECPIPDYIGKDYVLLYEDSEIKKSKLAIELLGANYTREDTNIYKSGTMRLVFYNDSGFEFNDSGSNYTIKEDIKSGVDTFLIEKARTLNLPFTEFKQDGYYKKSNASSATVVYKGEYNAYGLFDNYINVEVTNSVITNIKFQYKKPTRITPRDINVIPVYKILVSKMTEYSDITIIDVDIGFKGYSQVGKESKTYEGLAWRIRTTEGKEFYFNARNGEPM